MSLYPWVSTSEHLGLSGASRVNQEPMANLRLETGETTLSFASHDLSDENVPGGHVRASESKAPLGMEIGLVSLDVASAQSHALREGGIEFSAPVTNPWGQIVSYVRAPDGFLIELCTPAGE